MTDADLSPVLVNDVEIDLARLLLRLVPDSDDAVRAVALAEPAPSDGGRAVPVPEGVLAAARDAVLTFHA